jgi:hypothetical protein
MYVSLRLMESVTGVADFKNLEQQHFENTISFVSCVFLTPQQFADLLSCYLVEVMKQYVVFGSPR